MTYPVKFFAKRGGGEAIDIDLTKPTEELAKFLGADNVDAIDAIRIAAKLGPVFCCFCPYMEEIHGENSLFFTNSEENLHKQYGERMDDI